MMKFRLLLISLFLFVIPVFAQDELTTTTLTDEEIALLEEVQAAYDSFKAYPSVGVDLVQVVEQTITFGEESMTQVITIFTNSDVVLEDGKTAALSASSQQLIESDIINGTFGTEMIYVDGEFYINMTAGDGMYDGLFPEGWNKVSETPELQELIGTIDYESMSQFDIQFTPNLVKSIGLVAEEDLINAERGIAVSLLPEALLEQDFATNILEGFFGESNEEMETVILTLLNDAEMDIVYYFDADGVLIRGVMFMRFDGDLSSIVGISGVSIAQDLIQTTTYRYHDEPFTVTAPETE